MDFPELKKILHAFSKSPFHVQPERIKHPLSRIHSPFRKVLFVLFCITAALGTLHVSYRIAFERIRQSEKHMDMATASMLTGRFDDALNHYDLALRGNSRKRQAWSGRALALMYLKRYSEALSSYERVIRLSPRDAAAWQGKGMSLEFMGRYDEALESYNHAIELDPEFGLAIQLRNRLDNRLHRIQ